MRVLAVSVVLFLLTAIGAVAAPLVLLVAHADVVVDKATGNSVLDITLTPDSTKAFAKFTTENVGKTVELRIDGQVVMAPVVRDPITGGRVQVNGSFGPDELEAIARRLSSGKSKVEVEAIPG